MKCLKRILFALLPLLAFASCDYEAHQIEYEDIIGSYKGEAFATITVNARDGITFGDKHLNYGDTLVQTFSAEKDLVLAISANTDQKFSFFTMLESVEVLGKTYKDLFFLSDEMPIAVKGNHIVTWGIIDIETPSIDLPIETIYVPARNLLIGHDGDDGDIVVGDAYLAASMANYTIEMDLQLEKAPGLLTSGCTLWLSYKGVMFSKESIKER